MILKYNWDMKQVAVGGVIWSYREMLGIGTPIVIMHGWGRSGLEWEGVARELGEKTGRRVINLDLPGFGGTSIPADVTSIDDYAELVSKFLGYLKIKKVDIVGHSLGGRVGIVLSAKYGNLVEKLVLIDPAGVKPRSWKRLVVRSIAKLFGWVPKTLRRQLGQTVMDEDYKNSPKLRNLYRAVVGKELSNYLPKITCPTWVIWGERDKILPVKLVDVYKKLLPDPKVRIIWEAGHDPHLSHERELERALEEIWM